MICRVQGCGNDRMQGADWCGYHDEMIEDGEVFEVKPRKSYPNGFTQEEKAERWEQTRQRERASKRKKHPEWREITRHDGARTVEEMASMYDARRERDKQYKESNLSYACRDTQKSSTKEAVHEVLAENKRKREERAKRANR